MDPVFFKSRNDLRRWFLKNHDKLDELLMGFYLKKANLEGIDYKEAVDEALAFGWIDGIRKSYDDKSYTTRFTPRRKRSIWSKINIERIKELTEAGLMHESGLKVFENRDKKRANLYSFEQEKVEFTIEQEKLFKENKKAWDFFQKQVPSYKRPATWWVISAKQDQTQWKRLNVLIENSENGEKIPPLRPLTRKK